MKDFNTNIISDTYFCVDMETTSLDENTPSSGILEIYFQVMKNGVKMEEFHELYYHPNWMDTKHIHQISEKELKNKQEFVKCYDHKEKIKSLFKRCANPNDHMVFMAQYAPFEFKWFKKFLDLDKNDLEWFEKIKTYDTRLVEKILYPDESHSLINMCKKYNIKPPCGQHDFHRADQDVNAMWSVHLIQMNTLKNMGNIMEYDSNTYKFDFYSAHN